jgi:uncharacterized protein YkwD
MSKVDENSQLMEAAQKHASWMAENNKMSHLGKGGSSPSGRISDEGYRWSSAGENIAMGYRTAESTVTGWKNSAGHNRIMLGGYKHVGIGVAMSPRGSLYWAAVFATPAAATRSGKSMLSEVVTSGPISDV